MQMRIQLAALAGMLVTGLVVAFVTAWPTWLNGRAHIQTVTGYGVSALAQHVSQIVASRQEVAAQIASRSQIRDALAAYNEFRMGLAELAAFSEPRLSDALEQIDGLVGLTRFDREGSAVVQLGVVPYAVDHALLDALGHAPRISIIGGTDRQPYLQVVAPILSRQGAKVGADAIVFDMSRVATLLADIRLGGANGEARLHQRTTGRCVVLDETGLRLGASEASCGSDLADGRAVFTSALDIEFADGQWALQVGLDEEALFAPALSGLAVPLLSILVLVIAGALATSRAVRPFAQRLVRQADELAEVGRQQQALLELANSFVFRTDRRGRILEVSQGAQRVTGWSAGDLLPRLDAALGDVIRSALRAGGEAGGRQGQNAVSGPWMLQARDGRMLQFELSFRVSSAVNDIPGVSGVLRDVTERERYQERIRHLAHYDVLTGLPNRVLAQDRLTHAIERARRTRRQVGVLFIDLDRFKSVNDNLGHSVGDRLLQSVARRFEGVMRNEDTLARLGGDEFLVVLEDVGRGEDTARVADKLLASLRDPFRVDAYELAVGASIGICVFPEDGQSPDELIRCADAAMYRAKNAGRDTFAYFTAELAAATRERFELERGLRRALSRGEFRLVYQAQADCRTGRIVGAEALLRWVREDGASVPPDVFIPVAEELGMMHELGAWVLRQACADARRWHDAGHAVRLSVNLSSQQLGRADLPSTIEAALGASGLPAGMLELEVTEGHVMHDVMRCIDVLNALRRLGTSLAIDDFGTGYSSLAYLKRLPINRLKIDRSFVVGLPADDDDVAIVATVVAMARQLQLEVVAEGVETDAQRAHLARAGCAMYQGYLLARPESCEALIARLDALDTSIQGRLKYSP